MPCGSPARATVAMPADSVQGCPPESDTCYSRAGMAELPEWNRKPGLLSVYLQSVTFELSFGIDTFNVAPNQSQSSAPNLEFAGNTCWPFAVAPALSWTQRDGWYVRFCRVGGQAACSSMLNALTEKA